MKTNENITAYDDRTRPETVLCQRDPILREIISSQKASSCDSPDPDPIWGLIGVVIAQQISTKAALTIRSKVAAYYPELVEFENLRTCGLSPKKAQCCTSIVENAEKIRAQIRANGTWKETLLEIPGIGPWTLAIFRIFVLRQTDILPEGISA
jgi:DNA-3-methyladenine glycosylase II